MENLDRNWMYDRLDGRGGLKLSFIHGVNTFVDFSYTQRQFMSGVNIKCPCTKCRNSNYIDKETIKLHLFKNGFIPNYYVWWFQGERDGNLATTVTHCNSNFNFGLDNTIRQMVLDAARGNLNSDNEWNSVMDEEPNSESLRFYEMLAASDEPLYPGCAQSLLSVISRLLDIKAEHRLSQRCYNQIVQLLKDILPSNNIMIDNYYQSKKLVRDLGLPMQKIDCCRSGCMLFWGNDEQLTVCSHCGKERYNHKKENVPYKQMHYFPLTPRLRRLYSSHATARHMRWHHEHSQEDGVMIHPSDSKAWKRFNEDHPTFSSEIRNVRLGLCTDGFQPFGQSGSRYSSWPVIITPYNLPPWMCMKQSYMFLTVIVPGPNNPKMRIDVYLQPLINELIELWETGIPAYDISMKQNFRLRAALLWTISDFPAYSMLSGWSTAGNLACPYCMEEGQAFRLQNGGKTSWFDNHRMFLPDNHPFRRDKKNFTKNRMERRHPPPIKIGEDVLRHIDELGLMKVTVLGALKHNKKICKETGCGWKKRSIFWDLPYWKSNIIRHCLDVMHIEKNVFDNLFNTILNVDGKTKDNAKARADVQIYCDRPSLAKDLETGKYPKASYTLDKHQKQILLDWLKDLKFPDGYVSNLGRCVDTTKYRLFGMKSHDCHVFMQRLMPIAFHELLPRNVWQAITELSLFFKDLTSTTIRVQEMERLEADIPLILCKLERIFPPGFFDSMEHLPVHLPYEAKLAGPVQYRWMYPFERELRTLKRMIGNKASVEGSISEAYLMEESTQFFSHYFEPNVMTRSRNVPRNDDGIDIEQNEGNLSIFTHPGRVAGRQTERFLSSEEYEAAQTYILLNCDEVEQFVSLYLQRLNDEYPGLTQEKIDENLERYFASWFKQYAQANIIPNIFLRCLALGPLRRVTSHSMYFVNGYKFHTISHARARKSVNSGVCITGSTFGDYYGQIEEILELEYPELPIKRTVLFKCHWFDPTPTLGIREHQQYKLVEVNQRRKFNKYEPFVLAMQATQVYYVRYPSMRRDMDDWLAVLKIKPRDVVEETNIELTTNNEPEDAFQEEEVELHAIDTNVMADEHITLHDHYGGVMEIDENTGSSQEEQEFSEEIEAEFEDYETTEDDEFEEDNESD